jgi:hypothetical protein
MCASRFSLTFRRYVVRTALQIRIISLNVYRWPDYCPNDYCRSDNRRCDYCTEDNRTLRQMHTMIYGPWRQGYLRTTPQISVFFPIVKAKDQHFNCLIGCQRWGVRKLKASGAFVEMGSSHREHFSECAIVGSCHFGSSHGISIFRWRLWLIWYVESLQRKIRNVPNITQSMVFALINNCPYNNR